MQGDRPITIKVSSEKKTGFSFSGTVYFYANSVILEPDWTGKTHKRMLVVPAASTLKGHVADTSLHAQASPSLRLQ